MRRKLKFRQTTLILASLFAFLIGLSFAKFAPPLRFSWVWLTALLVLPALRQRKIILLICLLLFGFCLGWWRGSGYARQLNVYQPLYEQKVTLKGQALSDGEYDKRAQISFDLGSLELAKPMSAKINGLIKVSGFGESAIYRGDTLQVEGKLFPAHGSRQGLISYADLTVLQRANSPIEKLRRNFVAGMQSALPEPLASFGLGLLIGQRSTIPSETIAVLTIVGLTHIIAVSGYNLTIIMRSVHRLLKKRSKYQTALISLGLIILFLLFTGFSPSIVRAAVVSLLSLAAWYYGRAIRPILLIVLAAVITAGWNPLYLWFDVGWYLSFIAFFGVLILAPLLARRIYGTRKPQNLALIVFESLSAQVLTAPVILLVFGRISLIGIVANILVVPLVPLAMMLSLLAGAAGMITPALASWFALPAKVLLIYMLDLATLLSKTPQAVSQKAINVSQMLAAYVLIVAVMVVLWHKTRDKSGKIADYERT